MCKRFLLLIAALALLSASIHSFSMDIFEAIGALDFGRVRELVEVEKVDVNNIVDWRGRTPLLTACNSGNLAIVRLILSKCIDATINKAAIYGYTLLYMACLWGDLAIVKLLLEYGANVAQESLRRAQYNQNNLPNGPEILRLINLAQDLDNSESMFKFIDNQTNADQEFLRERLWKKHGIKVERKERTRVKRLLLEEDERVPMDSVCCVNGTTRIFNCIA